MSLPARRFTVIAPPHFLRVNIIYEIVFEVSGMPRIEDKQSRISQDEKIGFCVSFYFYLFIFN